MRARLIAAAKASLIEVGYGRTTAVAVCARAGVTRGALFHHFQNFSELLAAALEEVCLGISARLAAARERHGPRLRITDLIDGFWDGLGDPEFKAVIEVWLAARNDPELTSGLQPVIRHFANLASPKENTELAADLRGNSEAIAFYRLMMEAMIGMALGKAVTPGSQSLGHEAAVIGLLKDIGIAKGL
ncbi:MAG: TetR/AcrR family transcriptional regulator [Pseudomonadota bacterium]